MNDQPAFQPSLGVDNNTRAQILDAANWFPSPQQHIVTAAGDWSIDDVAAFLREQLRHKGVAMCRLPHSLGCSDFVELAACFGTPEPERDSTLAGRVQDGVVLNLMPDVEVGVTELTQPFSDSALTFHVEGSRRPPGTAPDFLLFQCLQAPDVDGGGQTVLRSISEVLDSLSRHSIEALAKTVMYPDVTTATVISQSSVSTILNFRDPYPHPICWRSAAHDCAVSEAFRELLTEVYRKDRVVGVPWRPGLVVIVDNRRWLHGRTAGGSKRRHLQRIRIQADPTVGVR